MSEFTYTEVLEEFVDAATWTVKAHHLEGHYQVQDADKYVARLYAWKEAQAHKRLMNAKPVPQACAKCGVDIVQPPNGGIKRFCSHDCAKWWQNHMHFKTVTCQRCGTEFERLVSSHKKYCSKKCQRPNK